MVFPALSRKVSAFLWDADGTIVDSRKFAFDATNDVLERLGKRTYSPDEFRELFSKDWKVHIKHMGITSERDVEFLVHTWNAKLATDRCKFKLYDGILDVLKYLYSRNYRMALVSSSSGSQLQIYFDMFAINKFFSVILSGDDSDKQEPSEKPFLEAAKRLSVSPLSCVFIDDTEEGIRAAGKLGVVTIGVTWGFNSPQRINGARPDFVANTPGELYRIIAQGLKC